jgi:hypothetical protein
MHSRKINSRLRTSANIVALAKSANLRTSRRRRGAELSAGEPFVPTETWYEPSETPVEGYEVVVQSPGEGYVHAVTAAQIRDRLSQLPEWMLQPLEVVQLSQITRKKQTFPCYGMQWASALYLYPIEESLVEEFDRPPKPIVYNEAKMYGGRWSQLAADHWQLLWTPKTLRDFYLNNILIHELGHLLDQRNTSYTDRERYAEWFAIEYGYRRSRRLAKTLQRRVRRRHHAS